MGEPGLAAAQCLSVPSGDPRGFAGPAALPVLPRGPKQHTDHSKVCEHVFVQVQVIVVVFGD